ncbi:MAG: hypothetical protein P8Y99_16910 [Calditrichaceae bacterium]
MYLKYYLIFLSFLLIAIGIFIFTGQSGLNALTQTNADAAIASRFLLTDLCLSTESRHTRHLSQPELIAPFQDAPGYMDHFPSSTFIGAPNLHFSFTNTDSIIFQDSIKNVMKKYDHPISPLYIRGDAEGRGVNN